MDDITATLKGAIHREGYNGRSFAKLLGMPYRTLSYRFKNPGTWRLCEWAAAQRSIEFNDSEILSIRRALKQL